MKAQLRAVFICFILSSLCGASTVPGTTDESLPRSTASQNSIGTTNQTTNIATSTGSTNQTTNIATSTGSTNQTTNIATSTGSTNQTTNPLTTTPTENRTVTSPTNTGISILFENILANSQASNLIQKQTGNFIKYNNVSFPISIMTPENLQKVLQLLGSGSNNLQGLSQYAGQLANIPNEFRNFTDDLEQDISPQCYGNLQSMVSGLTKREQWAIKMIDATGKLSSGLMDGNLFWPGSYDECLSLNAAGKFDGRYCTATISLASVLGAVFPITSAINLNLGVCMPDSCTAKEINTVLNTILGLLPLGANKLQTVQTKCHERAEYDDLAIAGFTVCGVFGVLMLLSTLFDVMYNYHQRKSTKTVPHENGTSPESKYQVNGDVVEKPKAPTQPGILAKLAMTFSVYTNGKKLLSTEQGGGALSASISWVVLGHSFSSPLSMLPIGSLFLVGLLATRGSVCTSTSELSDSSGENLSGTRLGRFPGNLAFPGRFCDFPISKKLLMDESNDDFAGLMMEKKDAALIVLSNTFDISMFTRLTPAYMLVLFLEKSLFRYVGDEPNCRETWWTNLLYINNLYNRRKMCFGWSWYLANDMQFYVVSPLLLVPLFLATYDNYFNDYYIVPWCRMGSYIVGIVTGYIIYRTKGKEARAFLKGENAQLKAKGINILIWISVAVTACVEVYSINGPANGHAWSNGVNALYNAVHRSVWGMCVCWVIFACVTGNGGIVNDFLSWKLFVPLGRLSYCIYLTHILVLQYYILSVRQPIYATTLVMIFIFLGTLMLSILVSIVASLAFEAPMMALEKVIFRRGKK
ncbi:nose resistant to fluoxetine protein 6-like [Argopecten irradians]|uniref:nose resistant to fluoxetine protein 6-like n=1 Tax=Argopecten irradians TaxID=31199 RepID=UPI003717DBBA